MKTENKKIRNAKENTLFGIDFRSKLEALIYRTLIDKGLKPKYEEVTFTFVPKLRPEVPFFKRIKKVFGLDMKPLLPITYTPDFVLEHNGITVIIEAKGFENDVYPVKRNLFRRHLETLNKPIMFFEIRNRKELLEALRIVENETPQIHQIRKALSKLPDKDISKAFGLLEKRDWNALHKLVSKSITKNPTFNNLVLCELLNVLNEILEK